MTLRVAVDFGTSSTCVAISVNGREPQVVVVDGQPILPSAVYAAPDGTLFVGQEAERQAAVDPSRYEPHPKRRVDEGELLLGTSVLKVVDVVRAVLTRVVTEARHVAGGAPVDLLVLTHPADWGAIRTRVLLQAARGLGQDLRLVPEPVAAAVFHSATHAIPEGAALAVLDLGGGTVDASVVTRQGGAFRVLATKGDPTFGGADVDQALLEHVGSLVSPGDPEAWRQLVEGREMADRRKRRVLRQDVRGAKETLSRHSYTDVPMPPPFPDAHVTRTDLESLITAPLNRAAALLATAVRDAGQVPRGLAGVFLVGGSSRIPLVARLVLEQTGVVPTSIDQPETVVARGALRAVNADPLRTGALPDQGGVTHKITDDSTRKLTRRITATPSPPGGFPQPAYFPPPPTPHPTPHPLPAPPKNRTPLLVGVAIAVAVVVGGSVAYALTLGDGGQAGPTTSSTPAGKTIAQYDYSFTQPAGWAQSGGNAETRQVFLKPEAPESGDDVITVTEQKLTYDSTADRRRAETQLRAEYDKGEGLSGFDASADFGGKDVVYYREQAGSATIDWYVLFQGDAQVSVGCQYPPSGEGRVRPACEQVVRTLTVTN
ncbi:type VII secretion-associated protein (TIGR03931 family) [Saccharothrix tamanrassetensis]|uniref:Type VII secretion-associated protein (TIGR03931 family) n=1 Tax=Saccharothrix tamanrassetensis TaxID=1051531 RepID=A0A841CCC4_9PSEU|nr:type VII secretion-associated protein [Saccharothrix tamanrassetensis]MBB5954891.1 type VII secretion-associated protein (TIGR03931 family) [Saccharothrix tamanrassetensis]